MYSARESKVSWGMDLAFSMISEQGSITQSGSKGHGNEAKYDSADMCSHGGATRLPFDASRLTST